MSVPRIQVTLEHNFVSTSRTIFFGVEYEVYLTTAAPDKPSHYNFRVSRTSNQKAWSDGCVFWLYLSQDGLIMQSSTELTDRVTYEMWDANGNLQSQKVGCAPAEAFGNSGTVVILPYEGEPGIMVVEGLEKVISDVEERRVAASI